MMKKCLLMFGLLVLALILAMVVGLSEDDSMDNQSIVEVETNASGLFVE